MQPESQCLGYKMFFRLRMSIARFLVLLDVL